MEAINKTVIIKVIPKISSIMDKDIGREGDNKISQVSRIVVLEKNRNIKVGNKIIREDIKKIPAFNGCHITVCVKQRGNSPQDEPKSYCFAVLLC